MGRKIDIETVSLSRNHVPDRSQNHLLFLICFRFLRLLLSAAGQQRHDHGQAQQSYKYFFHRNNLLFVICLVLCATVIV